MLIKQMLMIFFLTGENRQSTYRVIAMKHYNDHLPLLLSRFSSCARHCGIEHQEQMLLGPISSLSLLLEQLFQVP